MNQRYHNLIAQEFQNCVDNTIRRITNRDDDYRPFHAALLSEDVLFGVRLNARLAPLLGSELLKRLQNSLCFQMVLTAQNVSILPTSGLTKPTKTQYIAICKI